MIAVEDSLEIKALSDDAFCLRNQDVSKVRKDEKHRGRWYGWISYKDRLYLADCITGSLYRDGRCMTGNLVL